MCPVSGRRPWSLWEQTTLFCCTTLRFCYVFDKRLRSRRSGKTAVYWPRNLRLGLCGKRQTSFYFWTLEMFVPLSPFFFFSLTFPDKIHGLGPCNLRFSFSIVTTVFRPWDSQSRNSRRKAVRLSCDPGLGLAGKRLFFIWEQKMGVFYYPPSFSSHDHSLERNSVSHLANCRRGFRTSF